MKPLETMRVTVKGSKDASTINKADFDPDIHTEVDAKHDKNLEAQTKVAGSRPTTTTEKPTEKTVEEDEPSMDLSRDELVALAERAGATVSASDNKHDLVAAIKKANRAAARHAA